MNYVQTFIWLDGCIDVVDTLGADSANVNKIWPLIKSHVTTCMCSHSDKSYSKIVNFVDDLKGYINFTSDVDNIGIDIWNNIRKRIGEIEIPNDFSNISLPRGFDNSTMPCTQQYTNPPHIYPQYFPPINIPKSKPLDITLNR